ncbi:MAG: M16 family metallopeptidase [Gemmobacter sp.]
MRLVVAAALLILAAMPVQADRISDFALANGMQVVVIEDNRAPVVVHMVWYRVGAADEPPGKSGIAHFLEHLMFKGTETTAPGAFSAMVEAEGGQDNAFTSWDYTAYFQRVAADRLPLMMAMEADRMVNLSLPEDEVETERLVVLEERNQRTDSDPGALLAEQRRAAQFLHHPYRLPIIGWRHEIEGLTREDALDFYRAHYAPNNAILIVAGDVTAAAVRALAEEHYGPIPPNPAIGERRRLAEPPQLAERRLRMADPRVRQPYVLRSYLAPSRRTGGQARAAALVVLAEILGGSSATSVLGRALEFDRPLAVNTQAFYEATAFDDSTFTLVVVPVEGVSLDEAEAAMDLTLAGFLAQGVDRAQFERILSRLRAQEIYALDSARGQAMRYGAALTSGLSVEDQRDWPRVLQSVTPEDVMAAAADLFDRRRSVTAWLEREVTQ